jgi:cell fate regulator YaaT (PSP1 superfamily)
MEEMRKRGRLKKKIRTKREKSLSLDVSILGGGFDRFTLDKEIDIPPGTFVYIEEEGKKPFLVKVRGISTRAAKRKFSKIYPASKEKVSHLMKQMAKGILFENKVEDVKIVDVQLDIEVGHAIFTYIAEKKHNLSKIAAQLAKLLHVRVDFEQIGARDYARKLGGIGLCGRTLCCKLFLTEIPSITLDMARQQYLFAAPEKLSGICGRLLCCLRFEMPVYEEISKELPPLGAKVETKRGIGKVIEINVPLECFKVQYEDNFVEVISKKDEGVFWQVI